MKELRKETNTRNGVRDAVRTLKQTGTMRNVYQNTVRNVEYRMGLETNYEYTPYYGLIFNVR